MILRSGSTFLKILGSILLIGLLAYLLQRAGSQFSLLEVIGTSKRVGLPAFAVAGMWVLAQTLFQILRLWCLLPSSPYLTLGHVSYAFSFGQFLNSFVPARAGDVVKTMLVSEQKKPEILAHSAGIVVADKIVDLVSLFILVLLTNNSLLRGNWGRQITIALGIFLILGAVLFFARRTIYRRLSFLAKFALGLRCLADYKVSVPALIMSAASWVCEAIAVMTLVHSLSVPLSLSQAIFCLFVLNVAIAVPISVANVGTFETALVFTLNRFDLGLSESVAIASLHHVLQWLGISVWALSTWVAKLLNEGNRKGHFRVKKADKKRAVDYYSKMAGQYDHEVNRGIMRGLRNRERSTMLLFADLTSPAKTMIDVGCGNGLYALAAKSHGLKVTAVDMSPIMVERLRDKVDRAEIADIDTLSINQVFDRVVCAGVMDFVSEPTAAFRNLAALVAPGGKLVVLSPRAGLGGFYYRMEKRVFGIRVNLYNLKWYRNQAEKNGLEVVDHAYPLPTNMAVVFRRNARSLTNVSPGST